MNPLIVPHSLRYSFHHLRFFIWDLITNIWQRPSSWHITSSQTKPHIMASKPLYCSTFFQLYRKEPLLLLVYYWRPSPPCGHGGFPFHHCFWYLTHPPLIDLATAPTASVSWFSYQYLTEANCKICCIFINMWRSHPTKSNHLGGSV